MALKINIHGNDIVYSPSIKTTDAELKGYKYLDSETKDSILPLMELTKSRISKKSNPKGSIYKRAELIKELLNGRPFILDLTVHEDLVTDEIDELFDEDNGYQNWRTFLQDIDIPNVVPVVHADVDGDPAEIENEARLLEARHGLIAVRIGITDEDVNDVVAPIFRGVQNIENCLVIIDAEYIPQKASTHVAQSVLQTIVDIHSLQNKNPLAFIPLSSSFPRMVAQQGYGEDASGKFSMEEWLVYKRLENANIKPLVYGDYASIHPIRYQTRGGNWVPRVDAPMEDQYIYHRWRRDDGGYILAAREMYRNEIEYESCGSWGDNEIALAAGGSPSGKNPSHWIAVRENIHITRRVQLLSA